MAKHILERLQHLDPVALDGRKMTWNEVETVTRSLRPKTNLVVPKILLRDEPPYKPSRLGRRRGAQRQYRCHRGSGNLHVKEFDGHWVVHVDAWNPHLHVVRHLLVDRGFRTFLHVAEVFMGPAAAQPVPVPVDIEA